MQKGAALRQLPLHAGPVYALIVYFFLYTCFPAGKVRLYDFLPG